MQGLTETEAAKVLFVNYSQKFYFEIVKFIDDLEEDLKVGFSLIFNPFPNTINL